MWRENMVACALLFACASGGCHPDPGLQARNAQPRHEVMRAPTAQSADRTDLYQGPTGRDPEQREYARASRERLRAIQARAEELKQNRQMIPLESQGDAAATLNLLPSRCDETERDIEALETVTSKKWQQRKGHLDRKLSSLERSLDRAQAR